MTYECPTGLVRTLGADPHQTPLETMADVTNDFGVCVLQVSVHVSRDHC